MEKSSQIFPLGSQRIVSFFFLKNNYMEERRTIKRLSSSRLRDAFYYTHSQRRVATGRRYLSLSLSLFPSLSIHYFNAAAKLTSISIAVRIPR